MKLPINVLKFPVVKLAPELNPMQVFEPPEVSDKRDRLPIAVLLLPVELL